MRKRVLLMHPDIASTGGGPSVAVWMIEALKGFTDLTLLTWRPIDLAGLNRFFGTNLAAHQFKSVTVSPALRQGVAWLPTSAERLRQSLLTRHAKAMDRRHPYDVLIGTMNEVDFGRRGIQYIHFPDTPHFRRVKSAEGVGGTSRAGRLYDEFCSSVAPLTLAGISRNLTLVNSQFVGGLVEEVYGVKSRIVYPPVPDVASSLPWDERRNGFLVVGRITPSKRHFDSIEIVSRLRERGLPVSLTIVGARDDHPYLERLRRVADEQSEWMRLRIDISRDELAAEIGRHRYAIHSMYEEPFGIAVAEILRAGGIPFAHESGGPREILGEESGLLYSSVDDAVSRIEPIVRSDERQAALRASLSLHANRFSVERFVAEIRDVVAGFSADFRG